MWENFVEPDRPQMAIWRICIACWIPKATNTHNMSYLLLFHCNIGCTNASDCNVIRTVCHVNVIISTGGQVRHIRR